MDDGVQEGFKNFPANELVVKTSGEEWLKNEAAWALKDFKEAAFRLSAAELDAALNKNFKPDEIEKLRSLLIKN